MTVIGADEIIAPTSYSLDGVGIAAHWPALLNCRLSARAPSYAAISSTASHDGLLTPRARKTRVRVDASQPQPGDGADGATARPAAGAADAGDGKTYHYLRWRCRGAPRRSAPRYNTMMRQRRPAMMGGFWLAKTSTHATCRRDTHRFGRRTWRSQRRPSACFFRIYADARWR